ncbi:ABC transporter family substrate-binding protein [Streptosporangium saharense]|uniref:Peptide/nickel transport system substrate-binding protein n=1 Tax=Streptosporangium saharense TaxID=1706840 RepID=A0A7W7QMG7_9ACTN|nr:ABC transporter family substrate-binding protein [Streptosporangium saharense]MBB4916297.1 peptide/nickel transport system substrate-binding protein [Streptosporangium saharense]
MTAIRRVGVLATALTMAGSLALTGCGSQGGARGGGPGSDGDERGNSIKAYDINPVPRDRVRDGGLLRVGINEYPANWNLNHLDGNLAMVKKVVDALMPSAFRSNEKGEISANTDYLLAGKVTETRPKQVVTLTLNPRARWSDATPITWEDYRAQWQAMNGSNPDYRVASTTGYRDIEDVARGKDDHEVVVTFAKPFGDWQSLFGPLYPKSTNATAETFNTAWLNRVPVTAGPFRFASFDQTAKTITIARDERWWGQRAKLDRIIYRALESDALVGAFSNGELDTFDVGPSAPDYARAKSSQGAIIRQAAGPDFRHFTLNGESALLSDVNVRRAVAMGINRQAITQSDLQGLDWPIVLLNNHFFMNTQEGYRDNAGEVGVYNPERAKQLLDAAGWRLSGQTRTKDGHELNLRFVMPSGLQLTKSEAEITQSMLAQIGVKVTLQAVPSDDYFTKYIIPGNYDITAFAYVGTPFPVSSAYGQYANAVRDSRGQPQWNANLGRIGSPEIDAAMDKATSDLEGTQAIADTNAADKLIWEAVNVVTLYQRPQNVAVNKNIANYGARGFYDLKYQDIGFTR